MHISMRERKVQTTQSHNAVSVAPTSGQVLSAWINCEGFDKIAVTLMNDAATNSILHIYWSNDGVTEHGWDLTLLSSSTQQRRAAVTDTKAKYAKIVVTNTDAAAHTMSAWVYLKA